MDTVATGRVSLLGIDPGSYRQHALHASERTYVEANCYTDVLIELLHAHGLEHTWLAEDQEKIILNMHQELDRYLRAD